MTGLFDSADVFLVCCILTTVGSHTGNLQLQMTHQTPVLYEGLSSSSSPPVYPTALSETPQRHKVLPPENVRLHWINGLYPELSWTPPTPHVDKCTYQVSFNIRRNEPPESYGAESPWFHDLIMKGGFLNIYVQTICRGISSQPAVITYSDPDLVKDLVCSIISPNVTHCSWTPTIHAPSDLSFYYELVDPNSDRDRVNLPPLHECPSYKYTGRVRTGCELQVDRNQPMNALFNGTVDNRTVRNTHEWTILKVRARPLKWTVEKTKDKFQIRWTPDFPHLSWEYCINYTGCNLNAQVCTERRSAELNRVSECAYSIRMRAFLIENTGETEWTSYMTFEAETSFNPVLFAVVLVPLVMAVLALLTLFLCMKNKDKIFPKVPQPRFLVSDFSDNNNKINAPNFYFPKEEEECHVTLVIEPKLNKP